MEEQQEQKQPGFFSNLKNQIATGAGVILTGVGAMFMDEVKSIIGIQDEEPTEQVEGGNNQSVNVTGPEIIVNIPEQKPVEKTVIVKEVPVEKKKEKTATEKRKEEIDW